MFSNGSSSKEGARDGIVFISPIGTNIVFSYKLRFYTTNNVAEYEALVLGIEEDKKLKITNFSVLVDSELIINQVKIKFQNKHPRLQYY
jgi:ribonuclease HI